jgi:hypothetical protein
MKGECHRKALEDEFGAHEWAGRRNAGRIGRGRRRWRPSGKLGNYRRMALRMPRPATFFGDDVADSFATSNRLSGERIRELESSLKTKWRRKMPLCTHEETRRLRDEQQFSDGSCGNLGFFSLLFRSCDTPIRREGGKVTPPPPPPPHPPADRVFVAEYRMQRRNRMRRPTTGAAARRVQTHATFCMCRVCNCRFCGFVLTVHTLN